MSLLRVLLDRIAADGPMSVAEYMATCLLHPEHGYYTTRDPFGTKGDFVTAPEISQMFGELLGLCLAQAWMDQGSPSLFCLAELGPGRGTLMADVLRATSRVPGFVEAAQIVLVEVSPMLREAQAQALAPHQPRWIETTDDLPDLPLFAVANEFFDALPIRQFLRSSTGWRERLVGERDGQLTFGLGAEVPQSALEHRLSDTSEGDMVEIAASAPVVVETIARKIANHGGAALVVDYGDWRSLGDTFQAMRGHEYTDPLANPGQADLTSHVDFEPLAETARTAGAAHSRLTPQGVFLERLGITERARQLAAGLEGKRLDELIQAHRRLTHPDDMGQLFKVLGLFPASANPPPGLEP
ncbi:class I SAM-dependent methyltransferase [Lutimaribacter marinistellae]|uniref:Class I SAM-dependent methyltransferase n=1 Tax=Lutimaribacter marinistellae TaxID=1820329 RepID=A0ABV7TFD1_9RHOB